MLAWYYQSKFICSIDLFYRTHSNEIKETSNYSYIRDEGIFLKCIFACMHLTELVRVLQIFFMNNIIEYASV